MPKYRVTEKSFINNSIREEGDVVDYDGPVSANLEPLDGSTPGKAHTSKADAERMAFAAKGGDLNNPPPATTEAFNVAAAEDAGVLD